MSGRIGRRCADGCKEGDPLASEADGSPVVNDLSSSNEPCKYKFLVMPDGRTVLAAAWYEGVITGIGAEGRAIETVRLSHRSPIFVLERGCIHHRTIIAMAESAGIVFPDGNEIDDESEPDE
jgi:hypothetical protein